MKGKLEKPYQFCSIHLLVLLGLSSFRNIPINFRDPNEFLSPRKDVLRLQSPTTQCLSYLLSSSFCTCSLISRTSSSVVYPFVPTPDLHVRPSISPKRKDSLSTVSSTNTFMTEVYPLTNRLETLYNGPSLFSIPGRKGTKDRN